MTVFDTVTTIADRTIGHRGEPWERSYVKDLVLFDVAFASGGAAVAQVTRFGLENEVLGVWNRAIPYGLLSVILTALWILLMALSGSYSPRVVGAGQEEYRRIVNVAVRFLAALAIATLAFRVDLARGFVAFLVPVLTICTMTGRWLARRWLHRQRARGLCSRSVLVTGARDAVTEVISHLERAHYAGYRVVGACIDDDDGPIEVRGRTVAVVGRPHAVLEAVRSHDIDVLAVAGDFVAGGPTARELAQALEGTNVDLVIAPALTAVAGPRIGVRPVAGLPLLYVEQPRFSGPVRVLKGCVDRLGALLLLVVFAPLLLVVAVAIRASSRGPALFRQVRVGERGERFVLWKLRTMVSDAEVLREDLIERNEHDGPLFKIRNDPRVTPLGRWLRRFSLDEIPQLIQVLSGKMSLVGPRPPLPMEVEHYEDDVARRLLVKPGVTGLWQISGRADLTWDEGVRLDLYYVENWSLTLDFVIVWKSIAVVLRGRGAY